MAWVAVDKYDKEYIFQNKPKRNEDLWKDAIYESFDGQGGRLVIHHFSDIHLPKGTIKKLIGRDLTWNDEPVELKEEQTMWIARDKNDELWLYEEKPYKEVNQWKSSDGVFQSLINSDWFPEVSWGDDEPRELVLKPIKEE